MKVSALAICCSLGLLLAACGEPQQQQMTNLPEVDAGIPDAGNPIVPKVGVPVLGSGAHTIASIELKQIAGTADGLNNPRDVAFNPQSPTDLWIPNFTDRGMVILKAAGTPQQTKIRKAGPGGEHFMPHPSAMAFGVPGRMATAHEEDKSTQQGTPADFMGPSLWTTDATFEAGHSSHYDMLHNSPNAVGIAWEKDNVYWVFDGYHHAITRYDFASDHGPGGDDHSDGYIARHVEGQVSYVKGVSSHMEFDRDTKKLYIADTGNHRIAVLDTTTGKAGPSIGPNYDGCVQYRATGTMIATFFDGALKKPSGIALYDGLIYVSDNETSQVLAFDKNAQLVDYVDLSAEIKPGSLQGITFDAQGKLYVVDGLDSRVFQISAKPEN